MQHAGKKPSGHVITRSLSGPAILLQSLEPLRLATSGRRLQTASDGDLHACPLELRLRKSSRILMPKSGDRRASPTTPWPLVQPDPRRAPNPTKSPATASSGNEPSTVTHGQDRKIARNRIGPNRSPATKTTFSATRRASALSTHLQGDGGMELRHSRCLKIDRDRTVASIAS
jgi:hypothetical protein